MNTSTRFCIPRGTSLMRRVAKYDMTTKTTMLIHAVTIVLVSLKPGKSSLAKTGSAGTCMCASGALRNPNPNALPSAPPNRLATKAITPNITIAIALGLPSILDTIPRVRV